jgi:acyl carrier protein
MDKSLIFKKISEITETELSLMNESTKLSSLDVWDSLANVVFIAFAVSDFGVHLSGEELMQAETVGDLVKMVENKVKL